jgi:hypothetical protein
MRSALFICLVVLAPFGCADTVVLKDGTRHDGTFVRGTARTVTLVDDAGTSRTFDLRKIEELLFGSTSTEVSTRSRSDEAGQSARLLERLRENVTIAMTHTSLSVRHRDTLQDARDVLSAAIDDYHNSRTVDARGVRMALDNIRYLANSTVLRAADRRALLNDITEVRRLHPKFATAR